MLAGLVVSLGGGGEELGNHVGRIGRNGRIGEEAEGGWLKGMGGLKKG